MHCHFQCGKIIVLILTLICVQFLWAVAPPGGRISPTMCRTPRPPPPPPPQPPPPASTPSAPSVTTSAR